MASKKAVGKVASKKGAQTVENGVQTLQNEITEFAEKVQALSVNASYVPKGWVDGEVIYDEDLNHIEQGIASLADAANDLQSQANDLQNAIDEINTDIVNKSNKISLASSNVGSITVGANTYQSISFSVSRSGYVPICLVEAHTTSSNLFVYQVSAHSISDGVLSATVTFRNISSSEISDRAVHAYVLWEKQ